MLLAPAGVWLALLLVIPTLLIFELSLVPGIKPGDLVNPSGLENYGRIFQSDVLLVIGRSLLFATGTTLLCLLMGFPSRLLDRAAVAQTLAQPAAVGLCAAALDFFTAALLCLD